MYQNYTNQMQSQTNIATIPYNIIYRIFINIWVF